MTALLAVAVFASSASLDALHVAWNRAERAGRPFAAAWISLVMYAVWLVGLASVVEAAWWMAIPSGAGFAVGSFVAVRTRKSPRRVTKPSRGG